MKKLDLKSKIKTTATSTITSGLLNNEGIKTNILILPVLKELIKPLTTEEYEGLKANILQNGCQDSLKVWQTTQKVVDAESETDEEIFILIDGHNRHQICKETNTSFNITLMKFESLDNVKDWMVLLQLNRRNVSPNELAYYRGLLYRNALKEDAAKMDEGPSKKPTVKKSVQVAEQFMVDEKTIRRDGDYAEGVNNLSPELKSAVLSGKVKVTKQKIQDLGKVEVETKIESVEELEDILEITKKTEVISTEVSTIQTGQKEEETTDDNVPTKTGKKSTLIPTAQRANLISKFEKFMKTENIDDFSNFKNLLKPLEKLIK